jgi:hypothetical protein
MNRQTASWTFAAACLTLAATSACTAQPEREVATAEGARQCFLASQVNGFHSLERDHVLVTVGANRTFELGLTGTCFDIDWSQRIAIRSTGGTDWVCSGLDAELLIPSPIGPQRCAVTSVRRLRDEEARAARESRRH